MTNKAKFFILGAIVLGIQAAHAGDITGTITLSGTPPAEKEIDAIASDANCGKMHSEPVKTKFYVVDADKHLKDVVIVIKGQSGKSTGASAEPLVLDQKGCEYVPYVSAVQTGQKIIVKNSDPVLHNVHTIPSPDGGNKGLEKNAGQVAGAPDITLSFPAEENFLKFKCDVHPWMFSYVTVVDGPYFSVSGKDGSFKIANVPAGHYTVEAIHRKAGKVSKEIDVKDGANTLDFTLEVPAAK